MNMHARTWCLYNCRLNITLIHLVFYANVDYIFILNLTRQNKPLLNSLIRIVQRRDDAFEPKARRKPLMLRVYAWVEMKWNYSRCMIRHAAGESHTGRCRIPPLSRRAISMPGLTLLFIGGVNTLECVPRSNIPPDTRRTRGKAYICKYVCMCVCEHVVYNRCGWVSEFTIHHYTSWPWVNSDVRDCMFGIMWR